MTDKIKGLTIKEKKALEEYERLLLDKFPNILTRLILFGSKARGTSNRYSDLDLLVVVKKNGRETSKEIVSLIHEPIVHFGVDLSPIIIQEKEFKTWTPFLSHVKKEGVTIWKSKKNIAS